MSASPNEHPGGEFVLYQTEDGQNRIQCQLVDGTIWLSQMQMGELFQRSKKTISEHLQNIFEEGELAESAVVRNFRTTATDEKVYDVAHYNLEAVIAVGMRVKSVRGTQFRRWANTQLKEFIVKGFVMDDERLKNPGDWDYFDELLARIREIRASEKRFYQKVRDLFALSDDYQASDSAAQQFFAEVQNKLLYAVTQKNRRPDRCRSQQSGCPEHGANRLERQPRAQAGCHRRQELPDCRRSGYAQPSRRHLSRTGRTARQGTQATDAGLLVPECGIDCSNSTNARCCTALAGSVPNR